jgi:tRNA G46 methylase TrmB
VTRKGRLNWRQIFKDKLPVKLELASGTGDWVVAQALADAGRANWAAVELRHDRVYAMLSRVVLRSAGGLALIGAEGTVLLRDHVRRKSVAHIFVNFPEPPHRTGDEQSDGIHMLTDAFFRAAHRALARHGRLTIFSDNLRYCRSLAASVGGLRSKRGAPIFASVKLQDAQHAEDGFEEVAGIRLQYGAPGKTGGHEVDAPSYFERFFDARPDWEGGKHVLERCFLLLERA